MALPDILLLHALLGINIAHNARAWALRENPATSISQSQRALYLTSSSRIITLKLHDICVNFMQVLLETT